MYEAIFIWSISTQFKPLYRVDTDIIFSQMWKNLLELFLDLLLSLIKEQFISP